MRLQLSKFFFLTSVCEALFIAAMTANAAPLSYTGGTYSQNFDGLPTTGSTKILTAGPPDIQGHLGSTVMNGLPMSNFGGTSADTEFRAQDGSLSGSSGRGVVSFGTSGSTERALGVLATSNQISRFGVAFVNNTGVTLKQLSLNFT